MQQCPFKWTSSVLLNTSCNTTVRCSYGGNIGLLFPSGWLSRTETWACTTWVVFVMCKLWDSMETRGGVFLHHKVMFPQLVYLIQMIIRYVHCQFLTLRANSTWNNKKNEKKIIVTQYELLFSVFNAWNKIFTSICDKITVHYTV